MVDEIVRAKPAAAKGRYLLSITLATTMGPGIRVDASRTREAEILAGAGNGAGDRCRGAEAQRGARRRRLRRIAVSKRTCRRPPAG